MLFLLIACHLLFLLFWIRIWSAPEREFYFNPFLSGTITLTDRILVFLRPALYLPEQVASLVILAVLILFKTLLFMRLNFDWQMTLGTYFRFAPHGHAEHLLPLLVFSLLQTLLFLVRLWTVYFLVRLITPQVHPSRATEAFAFFSRPFSKLPFIFQPVALLVLHGVLAFLFTRIGVPQLQSQTPDALPTLVQSPFVSGSLLAQTLRISWLAALSFSDGLMLLTRSLFVLIIGNLIASLLHARGALILCSEGADMLMGRFARRATGGMGFDFTPLIYFFVVDFMYNGICRVLYELIHSPLLS